MSMAINRTNPDLWSRDVVASVRLYNDWFLAAAPQAYRDTRAEVVDDVEELFAATDNMRNISPQVIQENPGILATLRMSTAPPIARDRLAGLSYTPGHLIKRLEDGRLPVRMPHAQLWDTLQAITSVLEELLDRTLFDWLDTGQHPTPEQRELAAVVVSDRRCGAVADPIVRNAQEHRQLDIIEGWLESRGYVEQFHPSHLNIRDMAPGTFAFHYNVPVFNESGRTINMPIDAVIQPHEPHRGGMPLLIEAKSAGDFTNTNKRRKEEATKARQLKDSYGDDTRLILFLCGYFDEGYLGYEASAGIDWVWEHRPDDFELAGL